MINDVLAAHTESIQYEVKKLFGFLERPIEEVPVLMFCVQQIDFQKFIISLFANLGQKAEQVDISSDDWITICEAIREKFNLSLLLSDDKNNAWQFFLVQLDEASLHAQNDFDARVISACVVTAKKFFETFVMVNSLDLQNPINFAYLNEYDKLKLKDDIKKIGETLSHKIFSQFTMQNRKRVSQEDINKDFDNAKRDIHFLTMTLQFLSSHYEQRGAMSSLGTLFGTKKARKAKLHEFQVEFEKLDSQLTKKMNTTPDLHTLANMNSLLFKFYQNCADEFMHAVESKFKKELHDSNENNKILYKDAIQKFIGIMRHEPNDHRYSRGLGNILAHQLSKGGTDLERDNPTLAAFAKQLDTGLLDEILNKDNLLSPPAMLFRTPTPNSSQGSDSSRS